MPSSERKSVPQEAITWTPLESKRKLDVITGGRGAERLRVVETRREARDVKIEQWLKGMEAIQERWGKEGVEASAWYPESAWAWQSYRFISRDCFISPPVGEDRNDTKHISLQSHFNFLRNISIAFR